MYFSIMSRKRVIETDRLYLCEMHIEDARDFWRLNRDCDSIRYTGDIPFKGIAEARTFIKNYTHFQEHGFGRWSVFTKKNDEYIGFCGLKYLPERKTVDLGYRMMKKYFGNGYATESGQACLDYGFQKLKLREIVAWTMEENRASTRVLEKLGFVNRGLDEREDGEWVLFTRHQGNV